MENILLNSLGVPWWPRDEGANSLCCISLPIYLFPYFLFSPFLYLSNLMKSPRNIIIVSCKSLIIVTMPVKPLACVAQYRFRNFIFTFHNFSPGANGLSFTIGTSFVKKEQLVSNRSDRCECGSVTCLL